MSKSALYTGLSQGLMSLGKSAGRAMEFTAMETLRQQNLEKNWARQDAVAQADREYRSTETEKGRTFTAEQNNANRTHTADLADRQIGARANEGASTRAHASVLADKQIKARASEGEANRKLASQRLTLLQDQLSSKNMAMILRDEQQTATRQADQSAADAQTSYERANQAVKMAQESVSLSGSLFNEYTALETPAQREEFILNEARKLIQRSRGLMADAANP